MQYMTSAEIREKYLKFFEEKGCQRWPSSSLIPDDPSLLLTSAGMVQFKPYFLHVKELPEPYLGTTTVQKCVRTNDIDIIGTTGRHLSFFEMLGNFSFGKYFKKEMCAWAYEFSTEVLQLPKERLYFTVFQDDDETIDIWRDLGVAEDHISRLGEDDNFWRAGPTGPCGPCSEIYYDQGPDFGCGSPTCAPGCDCDRFLEYWNCVFTQYDAQEDGTLKELPTKNIDTGMGLERMAAIMQGVQSNYETDVMRDLISVGEKLSGKTYRSETDVSDEAKALSEAINLSLRIIADHSRSVTFMIGDGILPSNEGRGYVLRRLLRRAVMRGHMLGIKGPFLGHYVDKIVELMGHVYPELTDNRELIDRVVLAEEERFGATLRQGQLFLDEALAALSGTTLDGKTAFILHDTYGFPIEITQEICEEQGISVDQAGFEACMEEQRERARNATKSDSEAAWSTYGGVHADLLKVVGPSEFVGYDELSVQTKVRALIKNGELVQRLERGESGEVVLATTPFYAEMGGEVGDTGTLSNGMLSAEVLDTQSPEKGLICHAVKVVSGSVSVGDEVVAQVDARRRACITRNHTATHILHAALRQVLGDHVKQAGSYVGPDRLRFDFTHFEALTREQLNEIESVANSEIMKATPLSIYETSLNQARESGVIGLFGEKYGEVVRVVEAGVFSRELCGGCHVGNTAEIGFLKIASESSVGANVRRIEALTSYEALAYVNKIEAELRGAAAEIKAPLFDVAERCATQTRQLKELQIQIKDIKNRAAENEGAELLTDMIDVGYPLVIAELDQVDAGGLRNAWDIIRTRMPKPGACVLASNNNGTPILLAAGTDEAVAAGFHAGNIIKEIAPKVKGGGGGKPTMAQAGGKDAAGIADALATAKAMLC